MGWPWGWEQAKMDFSRFSFLYNNYKAYIPIVSFPQCCCSRISLLLHRPDFHHWIWGPDSKDTVGQGFTPGIIELSLNWKELFLSIFKFQLVTFIFIIELKYIDFFYQFSSSSWWQSSTQSSGSLSSSSSSSILVSPSIKFLWTTVKLFFLCIGRFLVTVLRHNQFVFE